MEKRARRCYAPQETRGEEGHELSRSYEQRRVYKSEQTKSDWPFRIPALCSERGSFCCQLSSRLISGAAVRRPGSHREAPSSNHSGYWHLRSLEEKLDGGAPTGWFRGWISENCLPHLHWKATHRAAENRKRFSYADKIFSPSRTRSM